MNDSHISPGILQARRQWRVLYVNKREKNKNKTFLSILNFFLSQLFSKNSSKINTHLLNKQINLTLKMKWIKDLILPKFPQEEIEHLHSKIDSK